MSEDLLLQLPHRHIIVLEGGFDKYDRFVYVPIGASDKLTELWRFMVVNFFCERGLVNAEFAKNILGWKHSGLSIESGAVIQKSRLNNVFFG